MSEAPADEPHAARRRYALALLPLVVFLALAALLFVRLYAGDASRIPSALIGQSAPSLDLPGLDGGAGPRRRRSAPGPRHPGQHLRLVVSALPCRARISCWRSPRTPTSKAKGVELVGVAQKDSAENIRRFLGAAGNPYAKIGLDRDGRAGIDWGVYGVPETFIVRGDGVIAYKVVGPMGAGHAGERRQARDSESDEVRPKASARIS